MSGNEKRPPARNSKDSLLALAMRVLRVELSEAEAVEIVRRSGDRQP